MTTANTPTSNGENSPKNGNAPPKAGSGRRKFSIAIPDRFANGSPALSTPALSLKSPDEQFDGSDGGILSKAGRRRTFSDASRDQDASMEGVVETDFENGHPRKRINGDTPDYPRRRATIAVGSSF